MANLPRPAKIETRVLPKLEAAIKEVEEAVTVAAYQHARLAGQHKDLAEWVEAHNRMMDRLVAAQLVTEEKLQRFIDSKEGRKREPVTENPGGNELIVGKGCAVCATCRQPIPLTASIFKSMLPGKLLLVEWRAQYVRHGRARGHAAGGRDGAKVPVDERADRDVRQGDEKSLPPGVATGVGESRCHSTLVSWKP